MFWGCSFETSAATHHRFHTHQVRSVLAASATDGSSSQEVLDDLRALGPVEGEFEDIVLGALASVETAFEMLEGAVR